MHANPLTRRDLLKTAGATAAGLLTLTAGDTRAPAAITAPPKPTPDLHLFRIDSHSLDGPFDYSSWWSADSALGAVFQCMEQVTRNGRLEASERHLNDDHRWRVLVSVPHWDGDILRDVTAELMVTQLPDSNLLLVYDEEADIYQGKLCSDWAAEGPGFVCCDY